MPYVSKNRKKSSNKSITNYILWLLFSIVYGILFGYWVAGIIACSQKAIWLVPIMIVLLLCIIGLAVMSAQMIKER